MTYKLDLRHTDCFTLLASLPDNSIDIVLTDPPYSLLDHKIEDGWDIKRDLPRFLVEIKRVLKKDGWFIFFGQQPSLSRWNIATEDAGFKFKQEIIWEKRLSSPLLKVLRTHENISIFGTKPFQRVFIPNDEKYAPLDEKMVARFHEFVRDTQNPQKLKHIKNWVDLGSMTDNYRSNNSNSEAMISPMKTKPKSYLSNAMQVVRGDNFTSIFKITQNNHIQHPTVKPHILLEYLLKVVGAECVMTVLDPFSGSGSTAVACKELNLDFIGCEIIEKYYKNSLIRINEHVVQEDLF